MSILALGERDPDWQALNHPGRWANRRKGSNDQTKNSETENNPRPNRGEEDAQSIQNEFDEQRGEAEEVDAQFGNEVDEPRSADARVEVDAQSAGAEVSALSAADAVLARNTGTGVGERSTGRRVGARSAGS